MCQTSTLLRQAATGPWRAVRGQQRSGTPPPRGGHTTLKRIGFATGTAAVTMVALLAGTTTMAAASADQGVTSTTIKVGIPYIDLSSLASQGVKLTQGSWPDAYGALIANLNARGGINGRKIVAYYEPVNLATAQWAWTRSAPP